MNHQLARIMDLQRIVVDHKNSKAYQPFLTKREFAKFMLDVPDADSDNRGSLFQASETTEDCSERMQEAWA